MAMRIKLVFLLMVLATLVQAQAELTINRDADVAQSRELFISTKPEIVWSLLTKIDAWGNWNERIKNATLKSDLQKGSTFYWKTNGVKITSTIHLIEPCSLLGWSGKSFGATATHIWYLEPLDSGTFVRVEESMDGWLVKLTKKKMNQILARDMEFWLEQLKKTSESYDEEDVN